MASIKVLLVEDNPGDVALIRMMLEKQRPPSSLAPVFQVFHVDSVESACSYAAEQKVDIVLLDLGLGPTTGLETFLQFYETISNLAVIVFTGLEDEELGLRTIHEGAQDYLVKGQVDANLLIRTIRYAIERQAAENELSNYKNHLEELVKERTKQLEDSYAQLRQAERLASVGALAAGIAHEINNPIATIILAVQNALEMNQEGENSLLLRSVGQRILNHANRCAQIVKGVLQFAKQQDTEKWANNLNRLTTNGVAFVKESTPSAAASIHLTLGSEIPPLLLNPLEIEQVVVNLVKNALQAGKNDTPASVTVATRYAQNTIVLEVSDNGRGMSEEDRRRIFDPFFTTRQQEGGTGLGLSIVHGIITAHGGAIDVESKPGQGTKISVLFPSDVIATSSEQGNEAMEC